MRKKVVVHIISNSKTGGAQTHLVDILSNIDNNDFKQIVICDTDGYYVSKFQQLAHTCYPVKFEQNPIKLAYVIRSIILYEKADAVHCHLFKACIIGTIAAFAPKGKRKILNNLHEEISDDSTKSFFKVWVYKLLVFLTQYVGGHYIVVSNYNHLKLRKQFIKKRNLTVVYNGVDENKFKKGYHNDKTLKIDVITVGRLHHQKNPHMVLNVAKHLPYVNFSILGDGEMEDVLKERLKTEKIRNVNLLGFSSNVGSYLANSDVFFLPSKQEALGIAILEAMACGLPVVASKTGGIPELVVNNKGGFLCNSDDASAFVDRIEYLRKHPELRQAFGNFNRIRFDEKFSLKEMIAKLSTLYKG